MYDPTFICTYNNIDGSYEEKNYLYRVQLIQALGLTKWDGVEVENIIGNLYNKIKHSDALKKALLALKKNTEVTQFISLFNENIDSDSYNEYLFRFLFSYEYFSAAHRWFADMLNDAISEKDIETCSSYKSLMENINM
ncbi:MAG: hypothetical protein CMB96_06130 [Flavobacteriaceae bacterium]|nr:hypothetical protein [Flavobacteriaceae bacterium]